MQSTPVTQCSPATTVLARPGPGSSADQDCFISSATSAVRDKTSYPPKGFWHGLPALVAKNSIYRLSTRRRSQPSFKTWDLKVKRCCPAHPLCARGVKVPAWVDLPQIWDKGSWRATKPSPAMEVLNPSNNIQTQRGFNDFWQSCCLFLKQVLAPTYKRNMHPTHKRKLSPLLQGRNRISSENSNLSCPKSLCCGRTQTYINHESVCKLV